MPVVLSRFGVPPRPIAAAAFAIQGGLSYPPVPSRLSANLPIGSTLRLTDATRQGRCFPSSCLAAAMFSLVAELFRSGCIQNLERPSGLKKLAGIVIH